MWANELITAANQAGAYLIKLSQGFSDLAQAVWSTLPISYRPASDKLETENGNPFHRIDSSFVDDYFKDALKKQLILNDGMTNKLQERPRKSEYLSPFKSILRLLNFFVFLHSDTDGFFP